MVITYLIKTQVLVGQSFIDGPVMSVLNAVCFHPDTLIKMKNGKSLGEPEGKPLEFN